MFLHALSNVVKLTASLFVRYGPPKFPLPRKVVERGIMKEPTLELRPPKFSVFLLSPSSIPGQSTPPQEVTVSSTDTVTHAREAFAKAISTQKAAKGQYRVWRIPPQAKSTELLFPAERLRTSGATELGTSEATVEDEFVDSGEAFVVEFMDRNEWIVNPSEFTSQPNGTLPQSTPPPPPPPTQPAPLFNSSPDFFTQLQQKSPPAVSTTAVSPFKPGAVTSINKPSTSARARTAQEPGTLGLGNMLVSASILWNNTYVIEGATPVS